MINKSTQVSIIGGGLAGTTLAWELYLKSVDFQIIDLNKPKATLKAAGIFNPVVFKRLTKSYLIDECLPVAKEFYQKIENYLLISITEVSSESDSVSSGTRIMTLTCLSAWISKGLSNNNWPFSSNFPMTSKAFIVWPQIDKNTIIAEYNPLTDILQLLHTNYVKV